MKLRPLKDIHVVVKLNYIGRLIIYTVELILAFSVFHHHEEPLAYWLVTTGIYLFWPTAAFLAAANSKDQKKSENNHILFEAFLVGAFFSALKFDLWACLAFTAINLLFYTMIGGPVFFLKSLGLMMVSGVATIFILPGFKPMPHSSVMTIVISNALILVSIAVMGISAHITNKRLSSQRRELKEKQYQIFSSLKYARTIQNSLMAVPESIRKELSDSFVIWEPRDIVGGDIYYTHFSDDEFFVSVIDCTGHGVPGALLSMVAASILQRIVRAEKIKKPSEILKRLNLIVKLTLYQDSLYTISDDGMDMAICVVHKLSRKLTYAGARIPLLIVRNGISEVIKGDKISIGYRLSDTNYQYTDHEIDIQPDTSFYLFSDGFTSQTGGNGNRMFGMRRLRTLLEDISGKDFSEQKDIIMNVFNEYHKEMKRKDDITMLGFSVDRHLQGTES
jgi:serine phosphatase RsbU (regulator of sigma subunit)